MAQIRELAYQQYQLHWMSTHGYSLQDLMQSLTDYQYADPEDSDTISSPIKDQFNNWLRDGGFGNELWVCYAEFLETEYLDTDLMYKLLPRDEFQLYIRDRVALMTAT